MSTTTSTLNSSSSQLKIIPPWFESCRFHLLRKLERDIDTQLKTLGPYLLTKRTTGYGSFAHVQEAIHKTTSHVFAVKCYHLRSLEKKRKFVFEHTANNSNVSSYRTALDDLYEDTGSSPMGTEKPHLYDSNSKLYLVVDFFSLGSIMLRHRIDSSHLPRTLTNLDRENPYKIYSRGRCSRAPVYLPLFDTLKYDTKSSNNEPRHIFPEKLVKCFLRDLGLAIKSIHDHGFVHRDIKPDNIFLECSGHIKLGDFSLATSVDSSGIRFTAGTYAFFAPELCEQKNNQSVDDAIAKASDLWALGVTTWIFFYGTLPFFGETCEALFDMIRYSSPRHPPNPRTSSTWSQAIHCLDSLLCKNPYERLTADQLLNHAFLKEVDYMLAYQYAQSLWMHKTHLDSSQTYPSFNKERSVLTKPTE